MIYADERDAYTVMGMGEEERALMRVDRVAARQAARETHRAAREARRVAGDVRRAARRSERELARSSRFMSASAEGLGRVRSIRRQRIAYAGLGADEDPKATYAKYADKVNRYGVRINQIRSDKAKAALRGQWAPLAATRDALASAFAPGASAGARDVERLDSWVKGVEALTRQLRAAEKAYGTAAPGAIVTPTTSRPAPVVEEAGLIPGVPNPVLLGGAALALYLLMK